VILADFSKKIEILSEGEVVVLSSVSKEPNAGVMGKAGRRRGVVEMPFGATQLRINAAISRKRPDLDSNAQRSCLTI
jgi:hypothetical protein